MNSFKQAILSEAKKQGYNQKILAEMTGETEVTMSRYLNLKRDCSLSCFMDLCHILKLDYDKLYRHYLYSRCEKRVAAYREEIKNEH